MSRLQGRYARVWRTPAPAINLQDAVRLQEIELQIEAILREFPELKRKTSNARSRHRRPRVFTLPHGWRRARLLN